MVFEMWGLKQVIGLALLPCLIFSAALICCRVRIRTAAKMAENMDNLLFSLGFSVSLFAFLGQLNLSGTRE
jgi:hypothetical protein